ncbi:helix-turn-helix transcriptional regulator [Tetragenococcus halophilus]|uniref:helix-turn-helix domain-containing protein n=1 Tax=Tetragenococcus halophilus TaxID=51669 RepID=UPI0030EFFD92
MIKIKLKELLDKHDLNISEFSKNTGFARSTITPLVNNPYEVKALKIETINLICDYFGVEVSDLLEFTPETKKYIFTSISTDLENEKSQYLTLKKNLGNSERYVLLMVNFTAITVFDEDKEDLKEVEGAYRGEVLILGSDTNRPNNLGEDIEKELLPQEIFKRDFERQNRENKVITTKIIVDSLIQREPLLSDKKLNYISLTWNDFPFFERQNYTFEFAVENNEVSLVND